MTCKNHKTSETKGAVYPFAVLHWSGVTGYRHSRGAQVLATDQSRWTKVQCHLLQFSNLVCITQPSTVSPLLRVGFGFSPQSALQQIPAIKYRTHLIPSHWTLVYAPSAGCDQQPMAKQQIAKTQPQKAPYVTPRIRTLKVSLSFASSASTLHDIFGLARAQALEPDKPEIPQGKRKAGNV